MKLKSLCTVAVARLVRFLGSEWSRRLDTLPDSAAKYPAWWVWIIVARMKTASICMAATGAVIGSWRTACRLYSFSSRRGRPLSTRNPRSCHARTLGNASNHQASEERCQEGRRTDKGCSPSDRQSGTPRSQPPARLVPELSLMLPSVGSQEASPSLPSQAQVRSSLLRMLSLNLCRPCDDVVSGGFLNFQTNVKVHTPLPAAASDETGVKP